MQLKNEKNDLFHHYLKTISNSIWVSKAQFIFYLSRIKIKDELIRSYHVILCNIFKKNKTIQIIMKQLVKMIQMLLRQQLSKTFSKNSSTAPSYLQRVRSK